MLFIIILLISLIIVWLVLVSIRNSKNKAAVLMANKKPVYIYFHVCCLELDEKRNWKYIVNYIFDYLEKFDAFKKITEMRVCLLGADECIHDPIWKRHPNIKIHAHDSDMALYERFTIHTMRNDAKEETFNAFYMHSKGFRTGINKSKPWVEEMLFNGWKEFNFIMQQLKIFDTIGTRLKFRDGFIGSHYSGNYWWSKSEYLKTRTDNVGKRYYDPEAWVHRKIGCRILGLKNGQKDQDMIVYRIPNGKKHYYGKNITS